MPTLPLDIFRKFPKTLVDLLINEPTDSLNESCTMSKTHIRNHRIHGTGKFT